MFPTIHVLEPNHLARRAQFLALGSIVLPLLAIPAILMAGAGWVRGLFRPSVAGKWSAARAIVAAMVLAPIGVTWLGNLWTHGAPSLTTFGSGSEIKAIPLVSPGSAFTLLSTKVQSDGGGSTTLNPGYTGFDGTQPQRIVEVSNQMSLTVWSDSRQQQGVTTMMGLAPSPSLAKSLFSQLVSSYTDGGVSGFGVPGVPGAQGYEQRMSDGTIAEGVVAERGAAIVIIDVFGGPSVSEARALGASTLSAQVAAVPRSIASLDKTRDSSEYRHNLTYSIRKGIFIADVPIVLAMIALAIITLVVEGGRKATKPRGTPMRGWYVDPTFRFAAREWSGKDWTDRVYSWSRITKDPLRGDQ